MDLEKMEKEAERLLEYLEGLSPDSDAYTKARANYDAMVKLIHADLDSRNADLDHDAKRELDEKKFEQSCVEEENRVKQAKWNIYFGIGKTVLVGGILVGSLVLTGHLEEAKILSQKCFSLATKAVSLF